jgi:hypothetical protein
MRRTGCIKPAEPLSRFLGGRAVYRLRPNDNPASISRRYSATTGQGSRIYEANQHLTDGPNLLIPGISLVIP